MIKNIFMKYALVTGSTKGIGLSIGEGLLKAGYHVFFNHHSSITEESFNEFNEKIKNKNLDNYTLIKADVSDVSCVDKIYNAVLDVTSHIDLIVFNAGTTDRSPFQEISYDNWVKVQNISVNIPVFILQKFYSVIKDKSNIVFTGSLLGDIPHATSLSYGVSKSAIHALVKNLVKFLAEKEIRVNGVAPGFIDTEWQKTKAPEIRKRIENKIALNKFGSPDNVRDLVLHIIANDYINGAIMRIDGGYSFQ